jgi:F-type H+-transporting ATPase subunit gamma
MKRASQISVELGQVETIQSLTGVFENIASMRIGRIKDQVLASSQFFNELWQLYSSLRVETKTPALAALAAKRNINKTAFVLITSEGGLSGDIDQKIIEVMKRDYHPDQVDLVVIGYHGVVLLNQNRMAPKKFFRLPVSDAPVDVSPVIAEVAPYRESYIYYQKFVSLAQQRVERIALLSAVRTLSEGQGSGQAITPSEYIFEPSIDEVVIYLETVMMGIALGQTILESRLSQLASRFNSMRQAQDRAKELSGDLKRLFFGAKRALSDERIREVVTAMEAL